MAVAALVMLFQLAGFAPPQAADHVVRHEIVAGHGASSGDRSIVYRSGSLIRIDSTMYGGPMGTSYTDLARGLVVSSQRDRAGVVQAVAIGRSFERPRRLPPTGRQDRALGESCAIRRLTDERMGSNSEICETSDGILLWYAFWYPHSADRIVMYMRATAVERRPVHPEEVLPPRDLLALGLTPPPATAAAPSEPDHEVEMVGDEPADGSYVQRRHGRFFSNARQTPGERTLYIGNGAITVDFKEDEAGRPLSLTIARVESGAFDRRAARWERVSRRRPERLLGETCTWQEDAAVRSTDRHYYCRTGDGIVLKTEAWYHWTGRTQRFTARRLSRQPLRDADFAVPPRALDWANWGITPVP
jgi:hypothetical protein